MEKKNGSEDAAEAFAGKVLGAVAVLAAAYFVFRFVVAGIFKLMMGGNSENGIYVLFYGGIVVLAVVALLGAAAGATFWRLVKPGAKAAEGPGPARTAARPQSAFSRGITIGFAVVALAAALLLGFFFWISRAVGN